MPHPSRTHDSPTGAEMVAVYKWAIGALTTLLLFFGSLYIDGVNDRQKDQSVLLLAHEQRITTLEESKRNTENLLQEIRSNLQRISNVIVK